MDRNIRRVVISLSALSALVSGVYAKDSKDGSSNWDAVAAAPMQGGAAPSEMNVTGYSASKYSLISSEKAVTPRLLPSGTAKEDPWTESYKLEAQGKYVEAMEKIKPLLAQRSQDEFIVLRIAWLRYLHAEYNSAAKAYQEALRINPQSLDARLGLSLPLMAQKKWNEAARALHQVLDQSPWDYTAHVRLMSVEEALGQWETLNKHANDLNLRYPSDATVLVYIGRSAAYLNRRDEARAAYEKVLHRYPGHLEATQYLSKTGAEN